MIPLVSPRSRTPPGRVVVPAVAGLAASLSLARLARILSWVILGWLGLEAGVAIVAAVLAGPVALLG